VPTKYGPKKFDQAVGSGGGATMLIQQRELTGLYDWFPT